MKSVASQMFCVDVTRLEEQIPAIVDELLNGGGAVLIPQAFDPSDIKEARELVLHYSSIEPDRATHFHGAHEDKIYLQRRVWNLLNKGEVFERMVQHPAVIAILNDFLGNEFILGSIAANRLMPGAPGQEPHIDYPYWDYYKAGSFPRNMNSSFPMNSQLTIFLDDFTPENGATAYRAGSQTRLAYPAEADNFYADASRQTGKAGDCVLFNGMLWHCGMPNNSSADRTGILVQYLAKFVTPFEDQRRGVSKQVFERATPMLQRLLGSEYPYPQLMDEAPAENSYGRSSQK